MRRLRVRMDIMIYDAHNQASYKLLNPFMTPRPFNARYLQARYKPVTSPLQARYKTVSSPLQVRYKPVTSPLQARYKPVTSPLQARVSGATPLEWASPQN